jgi:hypothetical protein
MDDATGMESCDVSLGIAVLIPASALPGPYGSFEEFLRPNAQIVYHFGLHSNRSIGN